MSSAIPFPRRGRERVWMAVAILALAALTAALLVRRAGSKAATDALPARFEIAPPAGGSFIGRPAISPDGRFVVSVVETGGPNRLWLRPLDSSIGRDLPGTEGTTSNPFWSPDGRSVAFFGDGLLKRVDISGGPARVLCSAPQPAGGTWNREDVILFAADGGAGLYKVSAGGGPRSLVARPKQGRTHAFRWPSFLPDGRRFLLYVGGPSGESGVHLGSLDSNDTRRVLDSPVTALYAGGLLFHLEQGTLFAQPFDPEAGRFSGEPAALVEGVGFNEITTNVYFSASDNGVVAFSSGGEEELQPTWYDRKGNAISTVGPPGSYDHPEVSPDGKRLVVDRAEASGRDVWLIDLTRGTSTRLTFDPAFDWMPAWTAGGSRIAFVSDRGGIPDLFEKAANGVGEETLLFRAKDRKHHLVSTADGRFLAFQVTSERLGFTGPRQSTGETRSDVWVMPLFGDRKPFAVLQSPFAETDPRFSPDGKWLAYASDETGRREVYVQSFPTGGGKWQVSTAGGSDPRWRGDGRELFYKSGRVLMAVPVSTGASFEAGAPVVLFDTKSGAHVYAVDAAGERFLVLAPTGKTAPPLTVLLDWTAKGSTKGD